ncbi:hypothetical protein CR159_20295 [Pollutimonas subterranea]|uniref:Uncharacterized protein n=1 Tax=Pollutimonas subterranea TaxID=2045210 RepID=A0A2N4TZ48_9BURK|nr:hypothetical protein CR159_20295 [Pollutimonas subterranea]
MPGRRGIVFVLLIVLSASRMSAANRADFSKEITASSEVPSIRNQLLIGKPILDKAFRTYAMAPFTRLPILWRLMPRTAASGLSKPSDALAAPLGANPTQSLQAVPTFADVSYR